jgi:serine/threonine-protein kinase
MRNCPSCSRECADNSRFCAWCAAPLDATSAETEALAPPASPGLSSSSSVDEGRFLPGTILAGRYRIAGLLGRGGMGEVYRATDLTLGQVVALKFLPEATARDERLLARFYNEVRIARQVAHPNVCRVYDIGQVDGLHYISMEYVDGEDLGSLLRRIGRLPVDKALETARKLCAGLAAAHEKGVLHRDLKPANIMIDGRGQVIVMDFGLAGFSGQLQGDIRSGTPAYMSPEQLAGTEVTIRSDIYSLGLVLYELFTGKRAFQAASLRELMEMQERATPASITALVKELDPAVERVIQRCLQPDPRKRPASALAVAAALPGGDPLAAALAAGETPSPELVAAAGETEGLPAKVAVPWLAAALLGIVALAVLAPSQAITTKLLLENSPEALTRDARTLIKGFGYQARPGDTAWGLEYDGDYRNYLKKHPKEAAARWKNPAAGQPPLVAFWYRESLRPMPAARQFNVAVSYEDPPFEMSGMVRLRTDPDGKLQEFEAVPSQVEAPAPASEALDWARLFQAAGLDQSRFQAADPQWTPLANWDTRAAWTGADPQTGAKLRVEAAAWRGRPVSFRIIGPWTVPARMEPPGSGQNPIALEAIFYLALVAACLLAWYNFRAHRVDQCGAVRMSAWLYVCEAASLFLNMHHTATMQEMLGFWQVVAGATLDAGIVWVAYLALEPWVRRRWPHTMISWTRYTTRGIRDPLVGRDLLYGAGCGALWCVLFVLETGLRGGQPSFPSLNALLGVRHEVAQMLNAVPDAIISSMIFFLMLFLLRVLLRKQWIAAAALVAIVSIIPAIGSATPWADMLGRALFSGVLAFVLLRFGLLAAIVAYTSFDLLATCPPTLDISAWYFGLVPIPLLAVALIAIYGFRTSLAGRPLFQISGE